jgi:hypothetical protein
LYTRALNLGSRDALAISAFLATIHSF